MHEGGVTFYEALKLCKSTNFTYLDVHNDYDLPHYINSYDFVIFNYHQVSMRGISQEAFNFITIPKICFYIDVQYTLFGFPCHWGKSWEVFNYIALPDPTINVSDKRIWKFNRAIPYTPFPNRPVNMENPIISTFGLHSLNKTLDLAAIAINNEFDIATFRVNFPKGSFVSESLNSLEMVENIKYTVKPGIKIEITQNFMEMNDLINWLNESDLNIFFYSPERDATDNRNIPSTIDQAIAARRPIAVSDSRCVDYFTANQDPYPKKSLKSIMKTGLYPVSVMYKEWSLQNFADTFDRYIERENATFTR